MEKQREDGKPYPPVFLMCLLSALNRILQDNKAPFSLFNKKDPQFYDLMCTLDLVSIVIYIGKALVLSVKFFCDNL